MKVYKRYILLLMAASTLSLQGCSSSKEANEIKVEQEEQRETKEEKNTDFSEKELAEEKEVNQPFSVSEEIYEELEEANLEVIPTEREIESEEDVVFYFEEVEAKTEIQSEEDYERSEETIQNALATFVLFLNDEMTIKDYTFSALKEESKEKILELFDRFDEKVNTIVPGYSKPIIKAFSFIEEKGKKGALILNNSLNEAFGEEFMDETKQNFKDGYQDMKDSFGFWKNQILDKAREEKTK